LLNDLTRRGQVKLLHVAVRARYIHPLACLIRGHQTHSVDDLYQALPFRYCVGDTELLLTLDGDVKFVRFRLSTWLRTRPGRRLRRTRLLGLVSLRFIFEDRHQIHGAHWTLAWL